MYRPSASYLDCTVVQSSSEWCFRMIKRIAKDGFNAVFLAYDHLRGRNFTIKQTQRGSNITKYNERELLNQRTLMHPYIVRLYDVYLTDEALCMVLEDAPGGNLETLLEEYGPLREDAARNYFQQMVIAVDYCHRRGTCVRNLKLQNLVLDETRHNVKVFDFNLSKHMSSSLPCSCVGTTEYFSPEVLHAENRNCYDGRKVDVWSLGVCLFLMLTKHFPFDDPSPDEHTRRQNILHKIKTERVVVPKEQILSRPDGVDVRPLSADCLDLLDRLLQSDPEIRLSIEEIQRHPWFLTKLPEGALDINAAVREEDERLIPALFKVPKESLLKQYIGLALNRG